MDTLLADFDALASPGATSVNETTQTSSSSPYDADSTDGMAVSVVPGFFQSSLSVLRPSTVFPDGQDTSPFTKQLFDFCRFQVHPLPILRLTNPSDLHRMCLKCILLDKDSHSYRKVVVPIALQSNLVFNALLALAASQMLPYQQDWSSKQKTLQYQGYSLRTLAHRISSLDSGGISESEILAAILMLCLLELMHNTYQIGASDSIDVEVHAFGAQRVLESPTFDATKPHNVEMSSFLGQMLSARFLLQFTAKSDRVDDTSAEGRARYWMSKTTRPVQEVNCFAGCSNELLSLLCDIICAIRQHGSISFDEENLEVLRASMMTRVQQVQQQELLRRESFSNAGQGIAISSEANRFLLIAEAYRHAAMILIERNLCLPGQSVNYQSIEEHIKAVLSEPSMGSAFSIPPPGKACRSSPLWPVFIAACHVTNAASRTDIVSYFTSTVSQDHTTVDILGPMLEVIEGVWERQVAGMLNQSSDGIWRFPWEEVLVDKGWELCWA